MNASPIKRLSRLAVGDGSRRGVLRTAAAGAALAGLGLARGGIEAAGGKKKRKRRCKPQPVNSPCQSNKDCCCQTNRICSTPCAGVPGSTPPVCCGSKGAACATNDDCCFSFDCNPDSGKCQEGVC
jgi:hypothetical protein